jgi:hypothetical protein
MKFIFREDIDRDARNWQRAVEAKTHGIEWKRFLPASISLDEVKNAAFLREYLKREYYESGKIFDFREWLKKNVFADQVEEDLVTLMGKPFRFDLVTIYLTTFHRAPYNPEDSSFFLFEQPRRERSVATIYHELMHFLFHWHYWDQCRKEGLSDSEIDNFKESITVLLNPVLEKRGLPMDGGYPIHEELRKKWTALYRENPDFPMFLERAIPLYKESLVK